MAERHTAAMSNENHDVIQVLGEKLDAVWRYDQYMQDASGTSYLQQLFQQIKQDDIRHIQMLRDAIARQVQEGKWQTGGPTSGGGTHRG